MRLNPFLFSIALFAFAGTLCLSAQNVGIGLTSPSARLDIIGASGGTNSLLLRSGNSSNVFGSSQIQLGWNGSDDFRHAIKSRHNNTSPINNAIDFFIWDQTTDAIDDEGTLHTMTLEAGNVGIGTTAPVARLNIETGTDDAAGVLFRGTLDATNGSVPDLGEGSRLMYYPAKAAFRAGYVDSTEWDNANVGFYSTAIGNSNIASGGSAMAGGLRSIASGSRALAFGQRNQASGNNSVALGSDDTATGLSALAGGFLSSATGTRALAFGEQNQASGSNSVAFGNEDTASGSNAFAGGSRSFASGSRAFAYGQRNLASGNNSVALGSDDTATGLSAQALGHHLYAPSFGEAAVGLFNTDYTPNNATGFDADDRVFSIGNGTSTTARNDAMVVLKSGNVGIGTAAPTTGLLHVRANATTSILFSGENTAGVERVRLTVGGGDYGTLTLLGPNGSQNFRATVLASNNNHGFITVFDAAGAQQAGAFVDAAGLGQVFGDTKSFRVPHPTQPNKEIWYAAVEGPEAAMYVRGNVELVNGEALVEFPEHFRLMLSDPKTTTITLTPGSFDSKGLAFGEVTANGFRIKELLGGTGTYEVHWEAKAVRKGRENFQVIRDPLEPSSER